ncbi:MAG: CBS domain-containing protein [Kofleriaceae bacterium]
MTRQPWAVRPDDSAAVARQMLVEREIHHLPVLDGDQLVGMVLERDLARAAEHPGATAQDVMSPVHRVDADASLEDVLSEMLCEGRDAVVVTTREGIAGIFTAMDAVRVLHDLMRRRAA